MKGFLEKSGEKVVFQWRKHFKKKEKLMLVEPPETLVLEISLFKRVQKRVVRGKVCYKIKAHEELCLDVCEEKKTKNISRKY